MKSVILIAAPAAGKGTEAEKLKEQFHIPHISTGDMLREKAQEDSELGRSINSKISNGLFVSDELITDVLKDRISMSDCAEGYILDGFPRTLKQAEAYDKLLDEMGKDIGYVIVLDVDKEIAKARISGRYSCPQCGKIYNINNEVMKPKNEGLCDLCDVELAHRSDDDPEVYEQRYSTYLTNTEPIIDYYDAKGVVYHVDASVNPDETHKQVIKILGE